MSELNSFLQSLPGFLRTDQILTDAADVATRAKETSHLQNLPQAFLFPENTAQVQQIVRLANQYQVVISPSSTGINWGYGGNNPARPGGVVLILERMNQVLEVNQEQAYAVIEPGVSYENFNRYLKEHNYDLWIDTIDGLPYASVLGNALDRGIGATPYGDHFGCICGMEVVLPNGEIIQTGGSSAQQPLKTWNTHKWGVGPYVEGLFTQSNFGIVTKAGIWLMPKPQAFSSYVFELRDENNLAAVIDRFHEFALQGIVASKLHLINDLVCLQIIRQRFQEDLPPGPISKAKMAELRKKYGFASWSMAGAIYGNKAIVGLQKKVLRRILAGKGLFLFFSDWSAALIGKLIEFLSRHPILTRIFEKVSRRSLLMLHALPEAHGLLKGIPTTYFFKHCYFSTPRPRPEAASNPAANDVGLTWFAPLLPFSSKDILPFLEQSRRLFEKHGFDFWIAVMMLNSRSVICLMELQYNPQIAEEKARVKHLYDELMQLMLASGYQQYRCANAGFDSLFSQAPTYQAFLRSLKQGIDPNQILAPGRYGI